MRCLPPARCCSSGLIFIQLLASLFRIAGLASFFNPHPHIMTKLLGRLRAVGFQVFKNFLCRVQRGRLALHSLGNHSTKPTLLFGFHPQRCHAITARKFGGQEVRISLAHTAIDTRLAGLIVRSRVRPRLQGLQLLFGSDGVFDRAGHFF